MADINSSTPTEIESPIIAKTSDPVGSAVLKGTIWINLTSKKWWTWDATPTGNYAGTWVAMN